MNIKSNANLQRINNHKLLLNPQIKEQNCIANFYNIESDKFEQNNTSKAITSFKSKQKLTKSLLESSYVKQIIKKIFGKVRGKDITKLKKIQKGRYGTKCNGSRPLMDFHKVFSNETEYKKAIQRGYSTNTDAYAYSFLKAKSDRPLSTSGVYDCSTIYFYNSKTKTHALYHYHPQTSSEELEYMINVLMPEGYTKANIVPGIPDWIDEHKRYLPKIFETVKTKSPNCKINVYHNMTKEPEIVGYKGRMFQIKNENIPDGQATFKITDIRKDNSLIDIHYAETIKELNKLKEEFNNTNLGKEFKAILNRLIEEKKEMIRQINNFSSIEKLKEFIKKNELENAPFQEYHHKYFSSIIYDKINALKNSTKI